MLTLLRFIVSCSVWIAESCFFISRRLLRFVRWFDWCARGVDLWASGCWGKVVSVIKWDLLKKVYGCRRRLYERRCMTRATVASCGFVCRGLAWEGLAVGVACEVVMASSEFSRYSCVAACRLLMGMKCKAHCARAVVD